MKYKFYFKGNKMHYLNYCPHCNTETSHHRANTYEPVCLECSNQGGNMIWNYLTPQGIAALLVVISILIIFGVSFTL